MAYGQRDWRSGLLQGMGQGINTTLQMAMQEAASRRRQQQAMQYQLAMWERNRQMKEAAAQQQKAMSMMQPGVQTDRMMAAASAASPQAQRMTVNPEATLDAMQQDPSFVQSPETARLQESQRHLMQPREVMADPQMERDYAIGQSRMEEGRQEQSRMNIAQEGRDVINELRKRRAQAKMDKAKIATEEARKSSYEALGGKRQAKAEEIRALIDPQIKKLEAEGKLKEAQALKNRANAALGFQLYGERKDTREARMWGTTEKIVGKAEERAADIEKTKAETEKIKKWAPTNAGSLRQFTRDEKNKGQFKALMKYYRTQYELFKSAKKEGKANEFLDLMNQLESEAEGTAQKKFEATQTTTPPTAAPEAPAQSMPAKDAREIIQRMRPGVNPETLTLDDASDIVKSAAPDDKPVLKDFMRKKFGKEPQASLSPRKAKRLMPPPPMMV